MSKKPKSSYKVGDIVMVRIPNKGTYPAGSGYHEHDGAVGRITKINYTIDHHILSFDPKSTVWYSTELVPAETYLTDVGSELLQEVSLDE